MSSSYTKELLLLVALVLALALLLIREVVAVLTLVVTVAIPAACLHSFQMGVVFFCFVFDAGSHSVALADIELIA